MSILKSNRGEVVVSIAVIIFISMFIIAFAMRLFPVFIEKQKLDTYASELCRVAAISGEVGDETDKRTRKLNETYHLSPAITWSKSGHIQLNDEISVACSVTKNIGLFGGMGSFPVTITGKATERSEVYWK